MLSFLSETSMNNSLNFVSLTQGCGSGSGRIRNFFSSWIHIQEKKSWIRIQESLCQKLFIFEQNLTNSKVKTGLRIRIREFFSSWIRIREKYFRSDPDPGKHFPDPQL